MRIYLLVAAVTAAVLLSACGGPTSRQALLDSQHEFEQLAVANGTAAAFERYAADDAWFLPDGRQSIRGRKAIVRALKQGTPPKVRWSGDQAVVSRSATLGSVWGTYVAGAEDKRGNRVGYGKFLAVWRKGDGRWRIAAFMLNASPGPGSSSASGQPGHQPGERS
jgi:ketosteroid isomerase-like protein